MFTSDLLQDKVVLITGGGTGLGRAMGERFLQLGARLAICGRRAEVLAAAAVEMHAAFGGEVLPVHVMCAIRRRWMRSWMPCGSTTAALTSW